MRQGNPLVVALGFVLVFPALALLLVSQASVPYATFTHEGRAYQVSEAYRGGDWYEARDWCAAMGNKWRLPTLSEAMSMREGWEGNDPFDTEPPCDGGLPGELWTLTECSIGAHQIHPLSTTVICDVPGYCECHNGPGEHYCCLHKTAYGMAHCCPVARCVHLLGESVPTETPIVTVTPEPTLTSVPTPVCEYELYVPIVFKHYVQ